MMYTIFDEYFICLVHDILNDQLNEDNASQLVPVEDTEHDILNDQLNEDNASQLVPVEDTEFVYRNLTIPIGTTFDKSLNIVVDGKHVDLSYISFNHDKFNKFLTKNIRSQAFDGISANIGRIVNVDNLTAEIGSRLSKIVSDLEDSNILRMTLRIYLKKFRIHLHLHDLMSDF